MRPVFDQDEFLERVGGDYELAADVARLFLEDCPRRLEAMGDAFERRDAAELRAEAHGLKGASGNMSATTLSALARELEEYARQGRLDAAGATLGRLKDEATTVLAAIQSFEESAAPR